jgi:hypothetical protein
MEEIQRAVSTAVGEMCDAVLVFNDYRARPSLHHRRWIGESGLTALSVSKLDLQPHEQVFVQKTAIKANDLLYNAVFYYISFLHTPREANDGDIEDIQQHLTRINVDTLAMRLHIALDALGGSIDDCFFNRIRQLINGLHLLFAPEFAPCYTPALYAACNLHQALIDYLKSDDEQYRAAALQWITEAAELIGNALSVPDVQNLVARNPPLHWFLEVQREFHRIQKGRQHAEIIFEPQGLTPVQLLRCLGSISEISKEEFVNHAEHCADSLILYCQSPQPIVKALAIRVCTEYLLSKASAKVPPIPFTTKPDNIARRIELHNFFSNYDKIPQTQINNNEISALHALTDLELRSKVACTIKGVDPVILERESQKPHGSFEIADMELEIRGGVESTWVCLPFKSGREVKTTVPEHVAHQIFRPFLHFSKCVVIFISAKDCSQNLLNYLKLSTERFGLPIDVVSGVQLAKLLKANSLL